MPSRDTIIQGLSRWIGACNDGDIDGFIPFQVNSTTVGYVSQGTADRLQSVRDSVFKVSQRIMPVPFVVVRHASEFVATLVTCGGWLGGGPIHGMTQ